MKFNKTLSFDGSREVEDISASEAKEKRRASLTKLERERQFIRKNQLANGGQPLDPRLATTEEYSSAFVGLAGVFIPIQNDFTTTTSHDEGQADGIGEPDTSTHYRDATHWPSQKREKVKKVRFVICILALVGLAFGLMSRLMLNVSIVEMVRKPDVVPGEDLNESTISAGQRELPASTEVDLSALINSSPDYSDSGDPLLFAATYDPDREQEASPTPASTSTSTTASAASIFDGGTNPAVSTSTSSPRLEVTTDTTSNEPVDEEDGLHFDWSNQDVNLILGAFYMGYMPGILFSGDFAQRYGAKYPLFLCIFGTAVINIATPTIARLSLPVLIGSRVLLGLIQGSLFPALYELFNRWLTQTESSIFAPMIKVSMPMGSLIGTLMPGLLARYQLPWPNLFYIGGFMCLTWSLVWLFVATSMPQTNRFVEQDELNRIMRKKSAAFQMVEVVAKPPPPAEQKQASMADEKLNGGSRTAIRRRSSATSAQVAIKVNERPQMRQQRVPKRPTPWLQIVTNPSVLALLVLKFTYNIGMDFIFLQLAVYLREAHSAPIETISTIASSGYCMQMLLISFVGWVAKVVVLKRSLGLSVTKWRKIFQGSSNFFMALSYLVLAYLNPGLEVSACLLLCNCFFWMLGAGGESMVPYDLSLKFPASIVGFTHSLSISSGLTLTAIVNLVVGENTNDSSRWSLLFYIISSLLALGGLVFVCVLKAKPFLPSERQVKQQQQQQQQQNGKPIQAISSKHNGQAFSETKVGQHNGHLQMAPGRPSS